MGDWGLNKYLTIPLRVFKMKRKLQRIHNLNLARHISDTPRSQLKEKKSTHHNHVTTALYSPISMMNGDDLMLATYHRSEN